MTKISSAAIAAALLLAQADAAWFRKRALRNIFDFSHREEQPNNVLKRKKVPNRVYVDMDQKADQSDVNLNIDAPNMNDSTISVNVEQKLHKSYHNSWFSLKFIRKSENRIENYSKNLVPKKCSY